MSEFDKEQKSLAAAEGFGISRNEDGVLVKDTPAPTVKYMKRFIKPGLTLLKFGKSGQPHERVFRLAGDLSSIAYQGGWLSKFGRMITIPAHAITRVQKGQATQQFQRLKKYFGPSKDQSLYVEYRDRRGRERTLNVIAPNPEVFDYLVNCLQQVVKKNAEKAAAQSVDSQYIEALWMRADKDKSGSLNKAEIVALIASMNINMPKKTVEQMFDKVDENKSGDLSFDEFVVFLDILRERKELRFFFSQVVNGTLVGTKVRPVVMDEDDDGGVRSKSITIEQFIRFWETTQGQVLTPAMVIKTLEIANPDLRAIRLAAAKAASASSRADVEEFRITYRMFCNVLTSPDNDLFDLTKATVYQDMTRPLSYYYISSSHNTYLEGDQLTSASSAKRYIDDLKKGCRCVELDVWDGNTGEPIITHGHTLTGTISFSDVINAIAEYGFENNPYPIILSIEQHCGLEQQKKQAKIMLKALKTRILYPLVDPTSNSTLPSPEELKGKVIIKGKRLGYGEAASSKNSAAADAAGGDDSKKPSTKMQHKADLVDPELSAMTFLATCKVKQFGKTTLSMPCDLMASYGESQTKKLSSDGSELEAWIKHNANHLSRVFPAGTRVNSSNYSPSVGWAAGCQLIALNFQTRDEPLHANMGRFRENGGVGYVLKPEYMINPVGEASPKIRLTIGVISGTQLPKPGGVEAGEIIDPYVRVSVWGTGSDEKEQVTPTISDNGFSPFWNKTFVFDISSPDTAVLTFHVRDEDHTTSEFVGFQALPVSCIRCGVRVVQLCAADGTRFGDFLFASLLVWVGVDVL